METHRRRETAVRANLSLVCSNMKDGSLTVRSLRWVLFRWCPCCPCGPRLSGTRVEQSCLRSTGIEAEATRKKEKPLFAKMVNKSKSLTFRSFRQVLSRWCLCCPCGPRLRGTQVERNTGGTILPAFHWFEVEATRKKAEPLFANMVKT